MNIAKDLCVGVPMQLRVTTYPSNDVSDKYSEAVLDIGTYRLTYWQGRDLATGVQALATALQLLAKDLRDLNPITPIDQPDPKSVVVTEHHVIEPTTKETP